MSNYNWYCLYKFNERLHKWVKLETKIAYSINQNEKYAVKIINVDAWVEIKTKATSLTQRDISIFKLGRNSIQVLKDENYEKETVEF